ncbi:uncharacterized protein LOC141626866 [Silene latifolia]|uniref:uncharacterized protein LOC141626866 n=1 Tax=Silene latifolia TaxID=37657 RepID=UPI003D76E212
MTVCRKVKLNTELFVMPSCEIVPSKRKYHLSPVDLALLSLDYIQYGLLFRKPPDFSISSYLKKLQHSLSLTLSHFYPLSGRLATERYADKHSCCIYVDCDKGTHGARLIHASALDLTCSDILLTNLDVPSIVRSLFELGERAINHDGHTRSLLSIQVTEISDGVFLGFSINHSVADGTSFYHFMNSLSEIVMGSSDISNALTALIWISISRARNLSSTEKPNCRLIANLRPRFKPPLSEAYFGVFVSAVNNITEVGQLLLNNLGWAAALLNQAVVAQDDNAACALFSQAYAKGPTMVPPRLISEGRPNPVLMMGSTRFDLYGLEFGLGRAVGVRCGYGNKADGLVRAFTGPEGEGSVELQICLAPHTMNALLSDQEFMSFVSMT